MMDDIEELKRDFGPLAKNYNDAQLRQLSREIDLMAEFLLDLHAIARSGERKDKASAFDTPRSKP